MAIIPSSPSTSFRAIAYHIRGDLLAYFKASKPMPFLACLIRVAQSLQHTFATAIQAQRDCRCEETAMHGHVSTRECEFILVPPAHVEYVVVEISFRLL